MRTITFDFFDVEVKNSGKRTLADALTALGALKANDIKRNFEIYPAKYIRLADLQHVGGGQARWRGDIAGVRTLETGNIMDLANGHERDLGLGPNEGLSNRVAFLYLETANVLVLQRNRFAVSAAAFALYFQHHLGAGSSVVLLPVLHEVAMKRLLAASAVRKLSAKVANVNKSTVRGQKGSDELLSLLDFFEAPQIEITVSRGQERTKLLPRQTVVQFVKSLITREQRNEIRIERLQVTPDDQHALVIDFLHDAITFEEYVNDTDRNLAFDQRIRVAESAWVARGSEARKVLDR